jgi:hypothetical protein
VGFVVDKVALGQVFPRVLRVFPIIFIPPVLHYKGKKKKVIIFVTGLHNKPQGCGASVASAGGPSQKKIQVDFCSEMPVHSSHSFLARFRSTLELFDAPAHS